MTGPDLRTLLAAMGVSMTELGAEVGTTHQAIGFNLKARRMKPETESRIVAALERIASRRRAERQRSQTEHLLALAVVPDISAIVASAPSAGSAHQVRRKTSTGTFHTTSLPPGGAGLAKTRPSSFQGRSLPGGK